MVLFLNDIAASEVMVIFLFILLFFGSKSIPSIARTMGRTIRQIKDASEEVQSEIRKSGMDMKKDMNLSALIEETKDDISRPLDQMAQDLDEAMNDRSVNGFSKMQRTAEKSLETPRSDNEPTANTATESTKKVVNATTSEKDSNRPEAPSSSK